ncbi:MAG: flavin reductase family protein [Candidatus Binatia bacterium]
MDQKLGEALAAITTGIYVLTVREGERLHGMSSSWVTQVSGEPPLIMAAVDTRHFSHGFIERQGVFGLNVVGHKSKELEDYFYSSASRRPDNLEPFAYEFGNTGVPLLQIAMTVLECRVVASYPAGDHTLFVASIVHAEVREQDRAVTSHDLPYIYVGTVIPRQRN